MILVSTCCRFTENAAVFVTRRRTKYFIVRMSEDANDRKQLRIVVEFSKK